MNLICAVYMVLLFFALTPGILLYLPSGSSKKVVALTHGVVFTAVWWLTHKYVWKMSLKMEGFTEGNKQHKKPQKPQKPQKPSPTS